MAELLIGMLIGAVAMVIALSAFALYLTSEFRERRRFRREHGL